MLPIRSASNAGCPTSRLLCENACPERSRRVGFHLSPIGILTSVEAEEPREKSAPLPLPPPPHRPPQNLPSLSPPLKPRPQLPTLRIQHQRLQLLHHPHRHHIPRIHRTRIRHQRINIFGRIRPLQMVMRPKAAPSIRANRVRRLNLHPPKNKTLLRIHNKIIRLAVPPRLRHHKSHPHRLGNKLRLRNLPQLLRSKLPLSLRRSLCRSLCGSGRLARCLCWARSRRRPPYRRPAARRARVEGPRTYGVIALARQNSRCCEEPKDGAAGEAGRQVKTPRGWKLWNRSFRKERERWGTRHKRNSY